MGYFYLAHSKSPCMDLARIMLVGAGGFIGSIARYVTVRLVDSRLNQVFPWGTFTVNVVGCFLIGLAVGVTGRYGAAGDHWRIFLGAGFCGGFTTFSAFALENHNLMIDRLVGVGMLYIIASVVLGILAVFAGHWCTRFL